MVELTATAYGLTAPVLVLNRSFQPVRVTSARRAFIMLYAGAARALDAGFEPHDWRSWAAQELAPVDESVGTPSGPIRVPRVLVLVGYNRVPRSAVRLSRRNVFLRDGYRCQYCGDRPSVADLNLDHVNPRPRGGRSTWENLVTSCRDCNLRKGRATPEECGMHPLRIPVRPTWTAAAQLAASPRRFADWEPFLAGVQSNLDALPEAV